MVSPALNWTEDVVAVKSSLVALPAETVKFTVRVPVVSAGDIDTCTCMVPASSETVWPVMVTCEVVVLGVSSFGLLLLDDVLLLPPQAVIKRAKRIGKINFIK